MIYVIKPDIQSIMPLKHFIPKLKFSSFNSNNFTLR